MMVKASIKDLKEQVSYFKSVINTKQWDKHPFISYLDDVKNGRWEIEVGLVRQGKAEKKSLPGITPSGVFNERANNNLEVHSGIIGIDVDAKENAVDLQEAKEKLKGDPFTFAMHDSASGNGGFVAFVKIDGRKHLDAFLALEDYYLSQYGIVIDKACKDVSRFRFVSFDPELFHNPKAPQFKRYLPKVKEKALPAASYIITGDDFDNAFDQINQRGLNLTDDYKQWYAIGGALADHYGENGRDKFHLLSRQSAKYNYTEADKMYSILLKRTPDKKTTIGTFIYFCQQNGIEVRSRETQNLTRIAKNRRKSVGTNGGMKNLEEARQSYLKTADLEGYRPETAAEIWQQVEVLPESELAGKSDNEIEDLKIFLKAKEIMFNEITRNYELEGKPMIDRDYNSVYIQSCEQMGNINRNTFNSLLDSNFIQGHNPLTEFFDRNNSLKPSGNFDALCSCIKLDERIYGANSGFLQIYLKKWMLGIISSVYGKYSISVLVLTGGQGIGKTNFFRNLLPEELQHFYAESKLDEGKDSEILMTKKLIILDDEFGGKSKQDVKKFKDISSKEYFTVRRPYGRASEDLKRLAVLAGTTNEKEILNDPTGNRRIIPINIIGIDHAALLKIDKTELFMELYHEWKADPDKFILTREEVNFLNLRSEENEQGSAEQDLIEQYFRPTSPGSCDAKFMSNTEIFDLLAMRHPAINLNSKRLGQTLLKLGYQQDIQKREGRSKRGYFLKQLY